MPQLENVAPSVANIRVARNQEGSVGMRGIRVKNHRRLDNGALEHCVVRLALLHPVSREWKGRWQRRC